MVLYEKHGYKILYIDCENLENFYDKMVTAEQLISNIASRVKSSVIF